MNLRTLSKDLNTIFEDTEIEDLMDINFKEENLIDARLSSIKSGFWSVVPFAVSETGRTFSMRLIPGCLPKEMPIVTSSKILNNNCVTYSPNLSLFFALHELNLLRDSGMLKFYKGDIKEGALDHLAMKLGDYSGEFHSFDFFKKYIDSDSFKRYELSSDEDADFTRVYLDFMSKYHDTNQFKNVVELIKTFEKESDTNILNFCNKIFDKEISLSLSNYENYGIWNSMVYNTLIQRYLCLGQKREFTSELGSAWCSFIQPHGFDAVSVAFKTLPNIHSGAERSSSCLSSVLDVFSRSDFEEFPHNMSKHPLMHAAKAIKESKDTYIGAEHVLAAAVLDEEYNDPVGSWNALVSAGYWCGENANLPNLPAWEAAIYLSEKHGWTEINEVLIDQLEFYNRFEKS